MKKVISVILAVSTFLTVLMLSGCAGFVAAEDDESIFIKEIKKLGVTEDGEVEIAIYFTDDEVKPVIFTIPSGAPGEEGKSGNGILGISHDHDDETNQTKVTIKFTDSEMSDKVFYVKDGLMVEKIMSGEDDLFGSYIYLVYNDGSVSENIPLPKGDPGVGIESYDQVVNEDKSVDTLFLLTNGDEIKITIPAPQTGNGIASMVSRHDKSEGIYYIDVTYTDGNTTSVDFKAPSMWYNGIVHPQHSGLEIAVGDYYVDTSNKVIYQKTETNWKIIFNFRDQLDKYDVVFDLNADGDNTARLPAGYDDSYTVLRGSYFSDNGYGDIPIPTRDGYNFVGWYTKKVVNPAVMIPFTDLTAVFGHLTLYAIWEPIN